MRCALIALAAAGMAGCQSMSSEAQRATANLQPTKGKGHFNPQGKPHGHPTSAERHAGDMPALRADASGNARLETDLDIMTVAPGPASVVGRGLIVHADPDDYKTQPTGNAGARLACAVIERR